MSPNLPPNAVTVMENVIHFLSNGPVMTFPEPLLSSADVPADSLVVTTTNAQILLLGSKSLIQDLELHTSLNQLSSFDQL